MIMPIMLYHRYRITSRFLVLFSIHWSLLLFITAPLKAQEITAPCFQGDVHKNLLKGCLIKEDKTYLPIDIYEEWQLRQPRFALKTNLLYGVTTLTPNIGADIAISSQSTIGFFYSYNRWKQKANLEDNTKLLHGLAGLQYRYWLCERFNGHFLGIDAFYSEYNVCGHDIPLLFSKEHRYEGNAHGAGLLYGYALPIGKMWNIEFAAGVNCLGMTYDRYGCRTCDRNSVPFMRTKFLPSASINVQFLIR